MDQNKTEVDHLSQSKKKVEENNKFLIPEIENSHKRYFDKITEITAGDIITVPQCKLCNHPLRSDAEAKWEQTKGNSHKGSYTLVLKFLNDNSEPGVKFNYHNVSVHMNHHYEQQIKRIRMREYGRNLASVINYKISKEEMFEGMIQALQLKLFEMASNPELDEAKQADIMAKLSKAISDASVTQAKLRDDVNVIDVYKEKVQNIIVNFIAKDDAQEQKELLQRLDMARAELAED